MMPAGLRKFILTLHITSSVGWLGAVAGFLVLAILGVNDGTALRVRAAYLDMDMITWFAMLPLSFVSIFTAFVSALGTPYGLIRYYWVVAKLLLTLFAEIILLMKLKVVSLVAVAAATGILTHTDLRQARSELVIHAAGGLLVLLTNTALAVYKPWGLISYRQSNCHQQTKEEDKSMMDQQGNCCQQGQQKRFCIKFIVVAAALFLLGGVIGYHISGHCGMHQMMNYPR